MASTIPAVAVPLRENERCQARPGSARCICILPTSHQGKHICKHDFHWGETA